jgi:hypothetical protein
VCHDRDGLSNRMGSRSLELGAAAAMLEPRPVHAIVLTARRFRAVDAGRTG